MLSGDEIWIVPGAEVAFVLRGLGDGTHQYIGHGYVHGLMQGEAWPLFDSRKPREVILV